ncbi:MAG: FAD-dependent oxidoreductase [Thiohalophilus sp.]
MLTQARIHDGPIHDVLIIGGGITGAALLYTLARYTDLGELCLLEKHDTIADINSHGRNNSQTLHCGDIETNYSLEKAVNVQATARMVVNYCQRVPEQESLIFKYPKMVLGVGAKECAELRERYARFHEHFPGMRLLEKDEIGEIEPRVTQQRGNEELVALAVLDEYSAVDFHALSDSFIHQARQERNKQIDVHLSTYVKDICRHDDHYEVISSRGTYRAKFVVVSAGAHSLLYAQRLGYGLNYSCLPVAGSFYYTPRILNGKVYTVQNEKLPFAAIHGDPDVLVPEKTRFGPTALVLPLLERHNLRTLGEFLRVFRPDRGVLKVVWDLFKVADIRNYMFKNFLFEIPFVRRLLFLRDARKIVPDLELKELEFAKGIGGIRPIMIDKLNRRLHLGEAKINPGSGIIFNMTPSPGATSCLGNAEKDMRIIADYLGCRIDEERFSAELLTQASSPAS